jgi:hypothetical protein
MALVDDQMAIIGNAVLHDTLPHETLNDRYVDSSCWLLAAAANPTDVFGRHSEEF